MTNTGTDIDLGTVYSAARQRITALVTADDVDLETIVPATPAWRVHDVIAHLVGITDDAMNGNLEGAPGEAWTAAQVDRGHDRAVTDLLADWAKFGPMFEGFLSSPAGEVASSAVIDVHTHEADLRHVLGLPLAIPDEFLGWAIGRLRGGFHTAVAEAGLPAVALDVNDAEWFRARLGRRTEAQVRAYDWSADPTPYLDTFFIFGPTELPSGEHL